MPNRNQSDGLLFIELTPTGYGLFDSSGGGGGIIVLFNQKITPVVIPQFTSIECLVLSVSAPITTVIASVYRPPESNEAFLTEFADLLSMLCLKFEKTLILGDFHVDFSTHNKGHRFSYLQWLIFVPTFV